jgi:hypothetical protein
MHKQHAIEEGPKPSMPKCQKPFNENLISLWMKGGFKPASGFRPARLEMQGSGFFFTFSDAHTYRCLHVDSDQSEPWNSSSSTNNPPYYTRCAAFCFLKLCFLPVLRAIGACIPEKKHTYLFHSHQLM